MLELVLATNAATTAKRAWEISRRWRRREAVIYTARTFPREARTLTREYRVYVNKKSGEYAPLALIRERFPPAAFVSRKAILYFHLAAAIIASRLYELRLSRARYRFMLAT